MTVHVNYIDNSYNDNRYTPVCTILTIGTW